MQLFKEHPYFFTVFLLVLVLQTIALLLGYHAPGTNYGKIPHFLLPAAGAPLLYRQLILWNVLKPLSTAGAVVTIVALGVLAEVLWEIYEFSIGQLGLANWQYGLFGTMIDIILAVVGSLLGAVLFCVSGKRRNGRQS